MREYNIDPNKSVVKVNYSLFSGGSASYSMNITYDLQVVIASLTVYIKVKIPEDEHDLQFRKEIVRTVMDVRKAMEGANRNFLIARFTENVKKAFGRDIRFPLKKVE